MTNPEDAVLAAIDELERDDIDRLVDWQIEQGYARGDGPDPHREETTAYTYGERAALDLDHVAGVLRRMDEGVAQRIAYTRLTDAGFAIGWRHYGAMAAESRDQFRQVYRLPAPEPGPAVEDCEECAARTRDYGCPPRSCSRCWLADNPGGRVFEMPFRAVEMSPDALRMLFGDNVTIEDGRFRIASTESPPASA
ncbi:hypothetical protein [Nocardia farcinica]|uniref:hypothetical protein n=1 Tax=Nocardia farcinica TaxID=37329 RepID=UPI00245764FD|nr:hypothetical protein [Nocardia farcinica]